MTSHDIGDFDDFEFNENNEETTTTENESEGIGEDESLSQSSGEESEGSSEPEEEEVKPPPKRKTKGPSINKSLLLDKETYHPMPKGVNFPFENFTSTIFLFFWCQSLNVH